MDMIMQMGVFTLLDQATFTVKCVLGLLVFMSVTSWTLIIYKYFSLLGVRKEIREEAHKFQMSANLTEAIRSLSADRTSPLYQTATQALTELHNLDSGGFVKKVTSDMVAANIKRSLENGTASQISLYSRSLSFLATCGNSAPFIGLFGTVWGIMHSFQSIAKLKTAALAAVAPGISEALIATAVGLAVAIPASIAYNYFLNLLRSVETELQGFSGIFINMLEREMHQPEKK